MDDSSLTDQNKGFHVNEVKQNSRKSKRSKVGVALTSPASCWKTLRNCFSSSLSYCSAYATGLRGGGYGTEASTDIRPSSAVSRPVTGMYRCQVKKDTYRFRRHKLLRVNVAITQVGS